MAGELNLSMVLRADASQAKAEFTATGKAVTDFRTIAQGLPPALSGIATAEKAAATSASDLKAALGGLHTDLRAQVAGMVEAQQAGAVWRAELDGVRASLNPLFATMQGLQEGLVAVAAAEEAGAISAHEAAVMHDQLARAMIELEARAVSAGLSLDGLSSRGRTTATALQQLIERQTGLSAATENAASAAIRHGAELDDLRARFNPLFAVTRRYEQELRDIAEAERLGAITATEAANARQRAAMALAPMPAQLRGIGTESRAAGAHMANLGYQLNDIGMMMSLGQSPFMLMMQQGPQVTQVFDQMRASGMAIGPALKSAFLGLLNPVSILTLGVIGLGAAGVQWLTSLGAEVETLEDRLDGMGQAISQAVASQRAARQSGLELAEAYGFLADEAQRALLAMAEADRLAASKALRNSAVAISGQFGGFDAQAGDGLSMIGSSYEETVRQLRREFDLTGTGAAELARKLQALNTAEGPEAIARAANDARDAFVAAGGAADDEFATGLAKIATEAATLFGSADAAANAALKSAQDLLLSQQERNALAAIEAQYGRESLTYLEEQQAQAAAGLERRLEALDVEEDLKQELRDALAIGQNFERLDLAAGIAPAVAVAQDLARHLGISYGAALALQKLGPQGTGLPGDKVYSGRGGDPRDMGGTPGTSNTFNIPYFEVPKSDSGRSGGGRGASEAERERKSVEKLIEKLTEERDVLRETDPIRQELLRYRRELAAATPEEAAQIKNLIQLRHEEASAIEAMKFASESAGRSLVDALMGGANAGERLIETLKRAALEALILGEGPLAGLFGTAGSGIFDGLFNWTPFDSAYADGGRVRGPGGPRDDKIRAWLSNGEYVINAAATAKHLPLIEAINSGNPLPLPLALADGGMVGMSGPSSWARAGATGSSAASGSASGGEAGAGASIYMDLRGAQDEAAIERTVLRAMRPMIDYFERHGIAAAIKKYDADPRRVG